MVGIRWLLVVTTTPNVVAVAANGVRLPFTQHVFSKRHTSMTYARNTLSSFNEYDRSPRFLQRPGDGIDLAVTDADCGLAADYFECAVSATLSFAEDPIQTDLQMTVRCDNYDGMEQIFPEILRQAPNCTCRIDGLDDHTSDHTCECSVCSTGLGASPLSFSCSDASVLLGTCSAMDCDLRCDGQCADDCENTCPACVLCDCPTGPTSTPSEPPTYIVFTSSAAATRNRTISSHVGWFFVSAVALSGWLVW